MTLMLLTACAPPTADELIEKSRAALEEGQPRTAEIHLKNLLQEEPNNHTIRLDITKAVIDGKTLGAN